MKRTLTIEYGDEILLALGVTPAQFGEEVALLTALKLYELGRLSAGAAAELAGLPKPVFLSKMGAYGVDTFNQDRESLQQDMDNACDYQ
jgi:predicted HTH domain antitoxin